MTTTTQAGPVLQHEYFCLPRPELKEPRLERYVIYRDNTSGRSVPARTVDRCLECGATVYTPI